MNQLTKFIILLLSGIICAPILLGILVIYYAMIDNHEPRYVFGSLESVRLLSESSYVVYLDKVTKDKFDKSNSDMDFQSHTHSGDFRASGGEETSRLYDLNYAYNIGVVKIDEGGNYTVIADGGLAGHKVYLKKEGKLGPLAFGVLLLMLAGLSTFFTMKARSLWNQGGLKAVVWRMMR